MAPKRRKYMGDFEAENNAEARTLGSPADDFSWDYELDEALRQQVAAQLRKRAASPGGKRKSRADRDPDVKQEAMSEEDFVWSGYVQAASAFDMFSSSLVALFGFVFAYRTHSISLACLAIQAVSHMMTSVLLAIRFTSERRLHRWSDRQKAVSDDKMSDSDQNIEDTATLLKRQRRESIGREQGLHLAMGIAMLISSLGLAFMAASKIDKWNTWYEDHAHIDSEAQIAMEALAWYGFSVYLLQAIFRTRASYKLRRDILWHAVSASVVALVFLLVLGVSASYQKEWSWRAEPLAAIILSLCTFIEGLRLLIYFSEDLDVRMSWDPRA